MWQKIIDFFKRLFSQVKPADVIPIKPPIENISPISLSSITLPWEKDHPERKAWTNALLKLITDNLAGLEKAQDLSSLHPNYSQLSLAERIYVWMAFVCAVTLYECGYNAKSASQDVGTATDKDSWSVGLLQLSVVDQKNYNINLGYTFDDLQDPLKNLFLGIKILTLQIAKRGKIFIPKGDSGVYWAVIHPGGMYDKSSKIKALIISAVPLKTDLSVITSETPWMDWMNARLGWNEDNNNAQLAVYWKYTDCSDFTTVRGADHAWCKMTVNAALAETGYKYNKSAMAVSGLQIGVPCEKQYGAIKIIEHASGNHHITFVDKNGDLGGNQHDSICVNPINPTDKVMGYRWPIKA